jgi:hypothetical protein
MEFYLTYDGGLLAHRNDKRAERSFRVHGIRKKLHEQLNGFYASFMSAAGFTHRLCPP